MTRASDIARAVSTVPAFIHHVKRPITFLPSAVTMASSPTNGGVKFSIPPLYPQETNLTSDSNILQPLQYEVMQSALESLLKANEPSDWNSGLSQKFIGGLLLAANFEYPDQKVDETEDRALYLKLRGLSERPFYQEVIHRLQIIQLHKVKVSNLNGDDSKKDNIMFLPADHFGMTELESMDSLIPHPEENLSSLEGCTKWLRKAGEKGILALLGMRRTIGTTSMPSDDDSTMEVYLFPPSSADLIEASCQLHRPDSNSSLTVAARALTKHADRGKTKFYGKIQGSESMKNEHAKTVVTRLIKEAAWVNIHLFGTTTRPVIEVRTMEGYGARWSALWADAFTPKHVTFRGFLEPHMEDGHEKRWRH